MDNNSPIPLILHETRPKEYNSVKVEENVTTTYLTD